MSRAKHRLSYAMARKRRMKFNVFVKPNEQAKHRLSYAMARKRRMKINPERDGASQCQKGKNRIFAILSFCVEQ